jgi:hypothetical protein
MTVNQKEELGCPAPFSMPSIRILNLTPRKFSIKMLAMCLSLSKEGWMTRLMAISLAAVVLTSSLALAQEPAKSGGTGQDRAQNWTASTKALSVSGKVSDDGRRFITDIDTEWAINNSAAVKGSEGRMVTIKCYVDSDKNRIQVLSLKRDAQYAAKYSDSAFRR